MAEGKFSLAQWNNKASSSSLNATSRAAHDAKLLRVAMDLLNSSPEVESKQNSKRRCQGRKHASIHNVMHLPSSPSAKCSIHDSNIDNRN